VVFHERSKRCDRSDEPFYPLRLIDDKQLLAAYVSRAEEETRVTFVGRLATYRYIDMHIAIAEALDVSRRFLAAISGKLPTPRFSVNPAVIG
jgi:UDP-galactopyranose mutase